jgi:hypothetical protein
VPNFDVASVVWGDVQIYNSAIYQTLYEYETNGSAVPFSNDLFGIDGE